MTAPDIIKQMKKAIKSFGEYSFEDKGPSEVMDLDPIIESLKSETPGTAKSIIEEVYNHDRFGAILAAELVINLDDTDEEWWDSLMQSEVIASLY